MPERAVIVWIPIETKYACQWQGGTFLDPVVCVMPATWEKLRTRGPDGLPVGRVRLRCDEHLPPSTPDVEHRKEL